MGTWGAGPFDNDDAGDLVARIRRGEFSFAGEDPALGDDEYVEAGGGRVALALVELALAVHGQPHAPVPDEAEVVPAFAAHLTADRSAWIVEQADRVLADPDTSQLYEDWTEPGAGRWRAAAQESVDRLRAALAG
jgi:hypothetical protein